MARGESMPSATREGMEQELLLLVQADFGLLVRLYNQATRLPSGHLLPAKLQIVKMIDAILNRKFPIAATVK
jgi:hypothetical protein